MRNKKQAIRRVARSGGRLRRRRNLRGAGSTQRQDPPNKRLVIAIDGPAGSGKSTTARALAQALKLPFIDTGAMYRAVTLRAMRAGIRLEDTAKLVACAKKSSIRLAGGVRSQKVFLDGKNVTKAIRLPEVTQNVFYVAREPRIRREMVKKQRAMGKARGAVMEGRDIGTKVFPDADYKFYFDADLATRARRRWKELVAAGHKATLARVKKEVLARDKTDIERKEGPLKRAADAILVDTSGLTIAQTVDKILAILEKPGRHD